MSILLDAVSKSKQQNSDKHDPLINPYHQFQQQQKNNQTPYRIALLCSTVFIGVTAAWWFSQSATPVVKVKAKPTSQVIVKQPKKVLSTTVDNIATIPNSSLEFAGKVALPLPKIYQPKAQIQAAGKEIYLGARHDNTPQSFLNNNQSIPTNVDKNENNQQQADYRQDEFENTNPTSTYEQKTIELGAPKNDIRAQNLEALRRQVELAASDVGLKTEAQKKQDVLVDKFQAALNQVERQHSISSPNVTDPALEPVNPSKNKNIPKYGELPAGVQLQVPEFNISAHMYSTDPTQRMLNVDGVEIKEGDKIKGKLKVIEIRPRDIVLEISGMKFKVPAI